MAKKTWIQYWLIDWAKWCEREGQGYSPEVTISRAMGGHMGEGTFRAAPPVGVDAPKDWMQRLIVAMGDLMDDRKYRKYILTMRAYYLRGPEQARQILKMPERTLRRQTRRGEELLTRKIKGS